MAKGQKTGGRQKGTPNRVTGALRQWIAANVDPAENLAKIARGESVECRPDDRATEKRLVPPTLDQILLANKILLDKSIPNARAERSVLGLPAVNSAADIPAFGRAVLQAVSDGKIACDEAQKLVDVAKALEPSELAQEIERLKAMVAALVSGKAA